MPSWLFIQTAENATISNNKIYTQIDRDFFGFSDRPLRKHIYLSATQFEKLWDKSPDSFNIDPPNAILTWVDQLGIHETEILVNDVYVDKAQNTITYSVEWLLEPIQSAEIFSASFFFDDWNGREAPTLPACFSTPLGCPGDDQGGANPPTEPNTCMPVLTQSGWVCLSSPSSLPPTFPK